MDSNDPAALDPRGQGLVPEPSHVHPSPPSPPPPPPPPKDDHLDSHYNHHQYHHLQQRQQQQLPTLPHHPPPPLSADSPHQPLTADHHALLPTVHDSNSSSDFPSYDQGRATRAHDNAFDAVSPDDFYKTYRDTSYGSAPDSLPMSPSASSAPHPDLRSNADGSIPRHPVVSPSRSLPRLSNVRSASNPVGASPGAAAPASRQVPSGKPSVKDLRKRFDQNGAVSFIPSPGGAPRQRKNGGAATDASGHAMPSYSALRAGAAEQSGSGLHHPGRNPRSQRPKYVAEDQVSNNPQSFASRVGKPRNSNGANPNASLAHMSPPNTSPRLPSASPPTAHPHQNLLFGEILPDQYDTSALGFGIDSLLPRGVSGNDTARPGHHQRSLSDPDTESASPSTWYRDANAHNVEPNAATDPSQHNRSRARSHSDATKQHDELPSVRIEPARRPVPPAQTQSATPSKLPLSVSRLNSRGNSPSPDSTLLNSPSTTTTTTTATTTNKRQQQNGKLSRATTPTSRARTPIRSTAGRRAAPDPLPSSSSAHRLEPYVGAPQPKLSPPLRSSRPRQPVSVASTASSRMKAAERSRAPNAIRSRDNSRTPEPNVRRRKISVGPIDFEQRREHIRLAYSKSLRESQALEARKRAAERRRQELEAAAWREEARREASLDEAPRPPSAAGPVETDLAIAGEKEPAAPPIQEEVSAISNNLVDDAAAGSTRDDPVSATPKRTASQAQPSPVIMTTDLEKSPDLGVPGSFPATTPPLTTDMAPPSAISTTTETTEFDIDQSIHPPVDPEPSQQAPITILKHPSSPPDVQVRMRAEYQYPFDDESGSPERPTASRPAAEPTNGHVSVSQNEYQSPYGAFGDAGGEEGVSASVDELADTSESAFLSDGDRDDDDRTASVPFPRLEMQDGSDSCSETDGAQDSAHGNMLDNHDDATTDACTEDTDDQGRTEDCMSESHFDDQLSANPDSSCVSSETGDEGNTASAAYDEQPVASNNLLAPPSRSNRLSQHSQWTDFTVESPNPSDAARSSDVEDLAGSPSYGHVTIFSSRVVSTDSDTKARESEQGPSSMQPSNESARSSGYLELQDFSNLDGEDDFAIPYLSNPQPQSSPYVVPSPEHDPPPVPTSAAGSAREARSSGVFYEQSQYGSSMLNSTRESEEYASRLDTPQTMDSNSGSTPDLYSATPSQGDNDIAPARQSSARLPDKERHRLIQRRNVIKELLDTEAVFVRDMNIVEEIYKGTAEACPQLDSKTVKQIFRNTDDIIAFHTAFLAQIKEAVASVYVPKSGRSPLPGGGDSDASSKTEISDSKDRETLLGPVFGDNIEQMKVAHEGFLRSSDLAAKRLIQIQQDPTVKVWLNECNEVAKELTAAWDLDSLLIKPMQRITKYPNLIITILQHTPADHPDRGALAAAKDKLETAIIDINKTKKNFELVGQIVGRKRKESDVRNGFARAFGKRVDKLQVAGNRSTEDPEYARLNEKFGDDYLRLQVVLRDVEFYTRQVTAYVRDFLQYLSSVELVMRLQPGNYPEIESKWVQFNISIRDIEKVALEYHLAQVRKKVIEPFEQVIKAYGNPSLAMKKRQKRRLDYERMEQLRRSGRSGDSKLQEFVEQYEALNDTLKKELPKLSALTEKVGNICLGNFVDIQASWYAMWREKMRWILEEPTEIPDLDEIVSVFQRDFPYVDEQLASIGILSPASVGRPSMSTAASAEDGLSRKIRSPRPSDVDTTRSRNVSINDESAPTLPTPDFLGRNSGSLTMSPSGSKGLPSPHQYYYKDYYTGIMPQTSTTSNMTPETSGSYRSLMGTGATSTRPSTGRSLDSGGLPRQSSDSAEQRRDSNTTYNSQYLPQETRRFSGLFHSALPLPDGPEESRISSRASSRERGPSYDGYNVLWLAASLFEFNITATKHEAGYPYLVYQAGELFDVIAEKGELWLAKNQDDPTEQVGWIWSKHFAKLADS